MNIYQVKTAGYDTDPTDYWPENWLEECEWKYNEESVRQGWLLDASGLDEALDICEATDLIVKDRDHDAGTWMMHPDAEMILTVYDGYIE